MTVMNLDKLEVWVGAKDFAIANLLKRLFRICLLAKIQSCRPLKRSASSIPANIAEGHGRYYFLDNVRFCYIARGSLNRSASHLSLARELGYLSDDVYNHLTLHAESIGKQLKQLYCLPQTLAARRKGISTKLYCG